MSHWADPFIGKPHAENAYGPDAFSCWGLVRAVFARVHGIDFPIVRVHSDDLSPPNLDNVAAIKGAARVSGMRPMPAGSLPRPDDIVLLRSLVRLHCGVVLRANGRLQVLHSAHGTGVVIQPWRDAIEGMTPELWRMVR